MPKSKRWSNLNMSLKLSLLYFYIFVVVTIIKYIYKCVRV
jgi:hypothetical protein